MGVTPRSVNSDRRNYSSYRATSRRRIRSRRIRALLALAVIIAGALLLLLPLAKRAIEHFELPLQYASIIRQQAAYKHVDPALIAAVIYAETRFRPRTSSTGAEGLMQIEPATAEYLAHRSGGVAFRAPILATLFLIVTLANLAMPGSSNFIGEFMILRWLAAARAHHRRFTINGIPIPQTRAYVSEVLSKQRAYRTHYARQLGYS